MTDQEERKAHCEWRSIRGLWLYVLVVIGSIVVIDMTYDRLSANYVANILFMVGSILSIILVVMLIATKGRVSKNGKFAIMGIIMIICYTIGIFISLSNDISFSRKIIITAAIILIGNAISRIFTRIQKFLCRKSSNTADSSV